MCNDGDRSLTPESYWASTSCLVTEAADPGAVFLFNSTHNVVLFPILEVFLTQFNASFDLELVHATIFFLSVYVAGRHEEALMVVKCLETTVLNGRF